MNRVDARERLGKAARRLRRVRSTSLERQAIRSFMAGAIYALDRAIDLDYRARSYEAASAAYTGEVTRAVQRVLAGRSPGQQWLAGFYFNASLQHLAGVYHRLLKVATGRDHVSVPCLVDIAVAQGVRREDLGALAAVHSDVNGLKHDPVGRLRSRRVANIELATKAVEEAVALFRSGPRRRTT